MRDTNTCEILISGKLRDTRAIDLVDCSSFESSGKS